MHRFLIALAIVVGVCALGAVGFVVYKSTSGNQTAVAPTDETAVADNSAKSAARPVRTRGPRTAPVIAAVAPGETASADSATAAITGSLDVDAFLKSLTPDELKALQRALLAQAMQQMRQDRRYQLPINGKFNALNRDSKLKLTPAQQAQLDAVMASMKPKMDAALQSSWAQQDQLRNQMRQAFTSGGDRTAADSIRQQLTTLNSSIQPQQDAFNQQVMADMTPYLTQDQVQALNTMPAQTGGGPGGGGFGPGGGNPGGGNPGGLGGGGGRRAGGGGGGGGRGGRGGGNAGN